VAKVLTDTLWRWSFDPVYHDLYRALLDGLVGYATRDPSFSPLRVQASRASVLPDAEQVATVTIGPGVSGVQLRIEREIQPGRFEDAAPVEELQADAGSREVRFDTGGAGVWRIEATGSLGSAVVGSADLFVVGPSRKEIDTALDPTIGLAALTGATGGRVLQLASAELGDVELRSEILARLSVGAEEPVWNHPAVFLILLLALGLEWFVERKIGYT
jgi:hypothetical protein